MVKFRLNKLGRDNGLEGFKSEGIMPHYKILKGKELLVALGEKLIEESKEVKEANKQDEIIVELADVLEVIDSLCKFYRIAAQELANVKEKKYQKRGGFMKGLFIESLEMDESNPRVRHFRASPDKYPEIND